MLNRLTNIFGNNMAGLYRGDGLVAIPNQSGYKLEKLKLAVHKYTKSIEFRITIEASLRVTDFLDVKLNLNEKTYEPFTKPKKLINYFNINSNDPQNIIESIK